MKRALSLTLLCGVLLTLPSAAQDSDTSSAAYLHSLFSIEGSDISQGCATTQASGKKPLKDLVPGCLIPIFHGNKGLYGSFANLPPGNSFALGAALKDSELNLGIWRMDWQIDGQGSFNGSWTTGGTLTMRLTQVGGSQPQSGSGTASAPPTAPANPNKPILLHPPNVHQGPIKHLPNLGENETPLLLNFYAFHTALNQVSFFGIGPDTLPANRSFFALQETIAGVSLERPLGLGFHLLGELNGRWPTIGTDTGQSSPTTQQTYTEATAPGLTQQPSYLQLGEGVEFTHQFGGLGKDANFGANLNLDWSANFQQFHASTAAPYSFRRLTIDATNEINLLKSFKAKDASSTSEQFGTLTLRGLLVESIAPAGNAVPFYFQPTLGGGDIDKERTLASYADYRFRAPNALLFRAQYEQPLPKFSFIGLVFRADAGKVGDARGDMDIAHLRHSYGAGFTLRAGNYPYVVLMYGWGGPEGHRTFADVNMSAISAGGGVASLW
jgi:hypothetical protein